MTPPISSAATLAAPLRVPVAARVTVPGSGVRVLADRLLTGLLLLALVLLVLLLP